MTPQQPHPLRCEDSTEEEEYYLVTRRELSLIKNDCAYPESQFCDGCEYADGEDESRASGLGCNFEGANAVMDRVLSRPAPSPAAPDTITKELALELCLDARKEAAATIRNQTQEHCDHECVCGLYYEHYESQFLEPCRHEINCPHDTRSRPAPPADAPTTRCCESCKNIPCKPLNRIPCVHHPENPCIENGCTDIENCDEICEHSRIFSPAWVKQHDATIRNQTLDPILKVYERFKHLDKVLMDPDFEDGSLPRLMHKECWKAIKESLRWR